MSKPGPKQGEKANVVRASDLGLTAWIEILILPFSGWKGGAEVTGEDRVWGGMKTF